MTDTYSGPFASAKPRVPSPVAGNLVAMDGEGDLTDSGVAPTTDPMSNDNSHVPTSAAMQIAILAGVTAGFSFQGEYDASSGAFPSLNSEGGPISKGDFWVISVGGTFPGGETVYPKDTILSLIDVPAQDPANWVINSTAVRSVFGRVGDVIAEVGDYDVSQVTDAASLTYVNSQLALKANLASPAFTGTPTAPTAAPGTATTQIATTDFVSTAVSVPPTNTLINNGDNTITSTVDSVDSTTSIITALGIYKVPNGIGVQVNGEDSGPEQIIDTNALSLTGNALKSTVEGVDSNTVNIQIPIPSPTNNNLVSMDASGYVKDSTVSVTTSSTSNDNTHVMTSGATQIALALKANLASPAFTGSPTAPTQTQGDNSNKLSTTAYVDTGLALKADTSTVNAALALKANLASPDFTGTPTAPTQTQGDNSNKLSTTAYVDTGLATKEPTITTLAATKGGTGQSSYTTGDILYASNSTTLSKLAASTSEFLLKSNGAGVAPSWTILKIRQEVQKTAFNIGLTTTTDVITALAPLAGGNWNASGYYILQITDGSSNCLSILYQLTLNVFNFGLQSPVLITKVSDTSGIITKDNLSNYLTFFAHFLSSSGYVAVTVRMTGGLLYGLANLQFMCTSFSESFISDSTALTQYIAKPLTNLTTPTTSYILNGNTISLGNYPASSLYAYAANGGTNTISLYKMDSLTGALSAQSPSSVTTGTTPVDVAITPNGRFLYTTANNNIYCFTLNILTGAITSGVPGSVSLTGASYMVMHPTGRFLFVVVPTAVSSYSINTNTGVLTLVNTITAGTGLLGVAINPAGTFLYVADNGANAVRQYTINTSTGTLTNNGTPVATLTNPQNMAVHPTGNFAYAVNNGNASIQLFTINTSTGVLTAGSAYGTGTNPRTLCFTPNGSFAYIANSGGNTVGCYSVNTSTGAFSVLSPATYATGTTPTCIRTDAGGRYLYITNAGSANISMFSISSTGALTSIGAAVSASTTPNQMAVI